MKEKILPLVPIILSLLFVPLASAYSVSPTSWSPTVKKGSYAKKTFTATLKNESVSISSDSSWLSFSKTSIKDTDNTSTDYSFITTLAVPNDASTGNHSLSIKLNGNPDISISLTVPKEEEKKEWYQIDLPNNGWLSVGESVTLDGVGFKLSDIVTRGGQNSAKVSLSGCSKDTLFVPFGSTKNTTCSGNSLSVNAITYYESSTTGELSAQFNLQSDYPYTVGGKKETQPRKTCDFQIQRFGSNERGKSMTLYITRNGIPLDKGKVKLITAGGARNLLDITDGTVDYTIPTDAESPLTVQVVGVENCEPGTPKDIVLKGVKKEGEEEKPKKPKLDLLLPSSCKPGEQVRGQTLNGTKILADTRVKIEGGEIPNILMTDELGKFFFKCPESGKLTVTAEHVGFRKTEKTVQVKAKKEVELQLLSDGRKVESVKQGNNVTLQMVSDGKLTDYTGPISVQIDNETYRVDLDGGTGTVSTGVSGTYEFSFGGNDNYKSASTELEVTEVKRGGTGGVSWLTGIFFIIIIVCVLLGLYKMFSGREKKEFEEMEEVTFNGTPPHSKPFGKTAEEEVSEESERGIGG